jgi:hypothetical protein
MSHSTRLFSTIALTTTSLVSGLAWLTVAMAEPPAPPPIRLSKVMSLADLHDEAAAQLTLVKQHLDTKKSYADSAKHELPRAAGLLAVIGQAITEHDSKPATAKSADRPPIHGPALRDVALKLAASKTHTQALETVPTLQAVVNGRSGRSGRNETRQRPWTGLISLHHIMEELNSRNSRLRRAVRRSRDPKLDARNAATMALLGVVVAADTHEVKQKAQLPAWKKYALQFQVNASATAAALRKGDAASVKTRYLKAAKACAACHSDFRHDE